MSQHGNVTLAAARYRAVVVLAVALQGRRPRQLRQVPRRWSVNSFNLHTGMMLGYFIQSMELVTTWRRCGAAHHARREVNGGWLTTLRVASQPPAPTSSAPPATPSRHGSHSNV